MSPKLNVTMAVSSSAFTSNGKIPSENVASAGNQSPPLSWTAPPANTKSVALIVDDSDADGFTHWLLYNISPETVTIPAAVPVEPVVQGLGGAMQGKNSTGDLGYYGPKPPPGGPHHYHFRVYALDEALPLGTGASKSEVQEAISGHVLAEGELVGVVQTK